MKSFDRERRQTECGLHEDVFALVAFPSSDSQDLPEKCFRSIPQENFLKFAKAILTL